MNRHNPRMNALCVRALEEWGRDAQTNMVMEECGELIAAINQHDRGRISDDELAGEVADVRLCLRQLEMMLGEETAEAALERKMAALHETLSGGEDGS